MLCTMCLAWTARACMLVRWKEVYEKGSRSIYKVAVRKGDSNNKTAAYVHSNEQRINWDEVTVLETATCYWKRRVLEAILICI